jgi:D-sedoheptulose 7-phosphate isomerase
MSTVPFSISAYLEAHGSLLRTLDQDGLHKSVSLVQRKYAEGRKVITCGNGGSASTASHYITDWNKMGNLAKGTKFRGISLCDNIGLITAYANDISYDEVFVGQLKAIMDEGDLVIAVSGSGNSPNVVKAVEYANANGGETLAIVGYDGGALKRVAKHTFLVSSFDMQLCEDMHLMFGHLVMKSLCGSAIRV